MDWTTAAAETFSQMAGQLNQGAFQFGAPPEFSTPLATVKGVRTEYMVRDGKVTFHFWPDPTFPQDFGARLGEVLEGMGLPPSNRLVEYVPELDSWYTHVCDPLLGATEDVAEYLARKIGAGME